MTDDRCPRCMHTAHLPGTCSSPSRGGCRECTPTPVDVGDAVLALHAPEPFTNGSLFVPSSPLHTALEVCTHCGGNNAEHPIEYPCDTVLEVLEAREVPRLDDGTRLEADEVAWVMSGFTIDIPADLDEVPALRIPIRQIEARGLPVVLRSVADYLEARNAEVLARIAEGRDQAES